MGLITETNEQYYAGSQIFLASSNGANQQFTTTFNTDLVFGGGTAWSPTDINYALNNFKIYTAAAGVLTYTEYINAFTVSGNTITVIAALPLNTSVVLQLKKLDGGNYGADLSEKAYGNTVEKNYGSYAYIKLDDIINNFIVAYVGDGKLIPSAKRTDLMFFAKRALQEFSYDTLKSINSQELTVPNNLSLPMPQDYVNYVSLHWIDSQGVKHIIMPTPLTSNPNESLLQATDGVPIQDYYSNNIETESLTEERWHSNNLKERIGFAENIGLNGDYYYGYGLDNRGRYGLDPQTSNINGYFTINDREGKFSFSSDLVDKLIILEYISDGLSTDLDTKVPKLAEEAMYAYMSHAVIASRINQPEYIVNRLQKEKSAKLRNAKIRLSNIKLSEIVQVMRGKSKWIKH
tara:strand:+ start:103 stop:1317 length:1215 start_codon:yes stop_codon:yes gene_type:complete